MRPYISISFSLSLLLKVMISLALFLRPGPAVPIIVGYTAIHYFYRLLLLSRSIPRQFVFNCNTKSRASRQLSIIHLAPCLCTVHGNAKLILTFTGVLKRNAEYGEIASN